LPAAELLLKTACEAYNAYIIEFYYPK
jgi:hypothetical protein